MPSNSTPVIPVMPSGKSVNAGQHLFITRGVKLHVHVNFLHDALSRHF